MPRRTIKSMFVELISFLTLFALIGTMTSNVWERYLIQSELSNVKSSLHLLKQTVHNIGAAYDNFYYDLNRLVDVEKIKPTKSSIPKQMPESQNRITPNIDTFSKMVTQEVMNLKANKGVGITASKGTDSRSPPKKAIELALRNATTATKNPLRSTGTNFDAEALSKHSTHDNYGNAQKPRYIPKYCKTYC